jgi:hypothetical protein
MLLQYTFFAGERAKFRRFVPYLDGFSGKSKSEIQTKYFFVFNDESLSTESFV